uniref:Uncharacterized protein n=1 Tax=Anguilla anguilla TaxID=7936 RepID=A0A0E9QRZ3_ANGAN
MTHPQWIPSPGLRVHRAKAFGLQASNSTMQNDTRYQCFMPGEQINGKPKHVW